MYVDPAHELRDRCGTETGGRGGGGGGWVVGEEEVVAEEALVAEQ